MENTQINIIVKAVDRFSKTFWKIKQWVWGLNNSIKKNQATFQKMAWFWSVAFLWLWAGIKSLTNDASNLVEINQKFWVVYSEMSDKASKTAKNLASSYGLAKSEARGYLADIGDLVSGLWYSQEASLDFWNTVVSLGTDLASFSNVAGWSEEAIDRLQKWLLWEHENLKALWIQINEEMVKTQLLADWTANLTWKALMQAKVEARLKLAMEQSKNAIWDYARSKDSLANKTREMNAKIQDLKDTLWKAFYPIILKITKAIVPIVEKFSNWAEKNEELVKWIWIVAIWLAGFAIVAGWIWLILPTIIAGVSALWTAFAILTWPIGLVVGAIALFWVAYKENFMWFGDFVDETAIRVKEIFWWIVESVIGLYEWIMEWVNRIKEPFMEVVEFLEPYIMEFLAILVEFFTSTFDNIITVLEGAWNIIKWVIEVAFALIGWIIEVWLNLITWNWSGAWEWIKTMFSGVWEWIKNILRWVIGIIWWILSQFWTTALAVISTAWNWIKLFFDTTLTAIAGVFTSIWDWISTWITGVTDSITWYVKDKFTGMLDFVKDIYDKVSSWFSSIFSKQSKASSGPWTWWATGTGAVAGANARGGFIEAWKSYLVWERWPELFTPPTSWNIVPNNQLWWWVTINMWWVVVKNEADENRLVEKIKMALSRDMQYASLWIN